MLYFSFMGGYILVGLTLRCHFVLAGVRTSSRKTYVFDALVVVLIPVATGNASAVSAEDISCGHGGHVSCSHVRHVSYVHRRRASCMPSAAVDLSLAVTEDMPAVTT